MLVSIFNAQALITPVDYTDGTTLNERPDGTGAWILDDFDVATFTAKFVRNPNWWGGTTPLDGIELRGFADIGTAVTAMASREVDVIQQFSVIGGEGLLNDSNFTVLEPPAANHRQVWFNIAAGSVRRHKPLVRQALAWCWTVSRWSTLFNGRAGSATTTRSSTAAVLRPRCRRATHPRTSTRPRSCSPRPASTASTASIETRRPAGDPRSSPRS